MVFLSRLLWSRKTICFKRSGRRLDRRKREHRDGIASRGTWRLFCRSVDTEETEKNITFTVTARECLINESLKEDNKECLKCDHRNYNFNPVDGNSTICPVVAIGRTNFGRRFRPRFADRSETRPSISGSAGRGRSNCLRRSKQHRIRCTRSLHRAAFNKRRIRQGRQLVLRGTPADSNHRKHHA